jgi:3-hydroxyisobutyrate dehydrogenase-like beta-hydroxyacid dehydrogenase
MRTVSTVGFVGLGLMGQGFTQRLIEKGHRVVGFDIDAAKVKSAAGWGVAPADSAAAVAEASDINLVSVINTAAVEDVTTGPRGFTAARDIAGKTCVDVSTTELEATQRVADGLAARGMDFIDAPVSGGPSAAKAGTLAIMAGGSDAAIAKVAPLMRELGSFTHMGGVGTGQAAKLVNQTIVLTNYCVLAEALRLAQAYGVDAAKIPEALKSGFAGSNMLGPIFPQMLAEDFKPRGFARQVLKDLEMLQAAARDKHLAMPMAAQALTLYRLLNASGKAELDAASVVSLYPRESH